MKGKHLWVLIALCGMGGASAGICFNTAGLFYTAIANDLGVGRASVALTSTIMLLTSCVASMSVMKIVNEKNLKTIIWLVAFLLVGSTIGMSVSKSVMMLYLMNAIRGIGFGLGSFVLITNILNHWFVEKLGMVTSIAMAFSGVPGVLLSPVISAAITVWGWRKGYLLVAFILLLFMLPAMLLKFSIEPEHEGLYAYGLTTSRYADVSSRSEDADAQSKEKINYFTPRFFLIMLFCFSVCFIASFPQHFPALAEGLGQSAATGSFMLSLAMAANILSKIVFGAIIDKAGTRNSIVLMAGISLLADIVLLTAHSRVPLLLGGFFFTFSFANSAVGLTVLTRDMYGIENYGRVYPVITLGSSIFSAVSGTLVGLFYDMSGSYTLDLGLIFILQSIAILSTLVLYGRFYRRKTI